MEILHKRVYEEIHVTLERGVDYTEAELEPDAIVFGCLQILGPDALADITRRTGWPECTWSSHESEDHTVQAIFRRPVSTAAFLNGPWRNGACKGYAIKAMQRVGLDMETVRKVSHELDNCFSDESVEEAESYYMDSDVW